MGMTAKGRALYALMEERGYSRGLVHVTVALLDGTDEALDDMIVFVADGRPPRLSCLTVWLRRAMVSMLVTF